MLTEPGTVYLTTPDPFAVLQSTTALNQGTTTMSVTLVSCQHAGQTYAVTVHEKSSLFTPVASALIPLTPNATTQLQVLLPGETAVRVRRQRANAMRRPSARRARHLR